MIEDATSPVLCTPVPPGYLHVVWPEVGPMLERATLTSKGRYTIEDVRQSILNGTYLLWVVMIGEEIVAGITTRVIDYPRCKAMALDWIGGRRMKEWIGPVNRMLMSHARHNGCLHMEGYGRAAWIRWNGRHGWKEDYITYRLELNDDEHAVAPV